MAEGSLPHPNEAMENRVINGILRSQNVLATVIITLALSASGCQYIMIGSPVETIDLTNEDQAQKNLEAIRAMQAERSRSSTQSVADPSGSPRF